MLLETTYINVHDPNEEVYESQKETFNISIAKLKKTFKI